MINVLSPALSWEKVFSTNAPDLYDEFISRNGVQVEDYKKLKHYFINNISIFSQRYNT